MTMNDPFSDLAARASAPPDRVLESIREEMKDDTAPKKNLSRAQRVAFSAGALVVGLILTSLNAVGSSPRAMLLAAAALSLSGGGLLLAGAVPGQPGRLGFSTRKSLIAVLSISAFTTLGLQAEAFVPIGEFLHADSLAHATKCAGHSLVSGVVGASALMLLWRRTDPFSPGLTGAFLGFIGGLMGTFSVGLLCDNSEGFHLTLGHGVSLVLLATVGLIVGRKWLTP